MKKLDTPLIRILKYATAALLVAVAVFVAVSFILHSRNRTPVKTQEKEDFEAGRVEEKEQIRHTEEEKGRPVMEFEADRHYLGKDGFYHLEGSVRVAFPQPGEKDNVRFSGKEIIHDEEGEWFRVKGRAQVEFEDGSLEAPSLEYDAVNGIIEASGGVGYHSGRLEGRAGTVQWKVKRKELFLQRNVRLEMTPEKDSPPVRVNCEEIEYLRKWGHGFLRGDVDVSIDNNRIRADTMEFRLTEERESIRSVKMTGSAEIALSRKSRTLSSSDSIESMNVFLDQGEKHFRSEEIFLVFFHDMVKIQEFRSQNGCEVLVQSESGDLFRLSSRNLRFRLNPAGGLKQFFAQGEVVLAEQREGAESFRIEAEILRIKEHKNILEILKGKKENAKAAAPGFEVWGPKMEYYLNNRNLEVKEESEVILDTSQVNNPGFFSSSEPLFIISEEMRYLPSRQRFFFTGETKFWQKKSVLESGDLILDKESGKVKAEEDVRFVFHYTPEDRKEEERIEIEAQRMVYRPYQNEVLFEKDGSFSLAGAELKAAKIILILEKEGRGMQGFRAYSGVTVEHGLYEGKAEQAYFTVETNQIVLTGNPVLKEKNRGSTEGDKLTFSLSDDRIIVENQGRERSLTVIK